MSSEKLVIPSKIEKIEQAAEFIEKAAKKMKFNDTDVDSIVIAITEAISNAIIHANKEDDNKKVTIEIFAEKDSMITQVTDEGPGFDPGGIDNPLLPNNLLKESGRGIFILNSLLDSVNYSFSENGTVVTMVKRLTRRK